VSEDAKKGIARRPADEANREFDLVVVGGGIYGAALLLEASFRGLRALLLESADFGGGTTRNCLRIAHGGLRHLQRLDLQRHRESVAERRWLLGSFPELVRPLPCLMPLDGRGTRRPSIMRLALGIDQLFSPRRNAGLEPERRLARGAVASAKRVVDRFPAVRRNDLCGGAAWSDAFIPALPRLVIEFLHLAGELGASAINYVEATDLVVEGGRVRGLRATDLESGKEHTYRASTVVNAAGPGCRALAGRWDRDHPRLFEATLAWNVLLDLEPPSAEALALTPPERGSQVYFLVPWEGRVLAGTGHAAVDAPSRDPHVARASMAHFLADLDRAAPQLGLREESVLRIYAGYLPGRRAGTSELETRPTLLNHAAAGGPDGLWSVSGVKFTTARAVADDALGRMFPGRPRREPPRAALLESSRRRAARARFGPTWRPGSDPQWREDLRALIAEEAVLHLEDLMLGRTTLADDPRTAREVAGPGDATRLEHERERLADSLVAAAATGD
jgi:glycerol-3-phosphate dehydrogenase